CASGIRSVTIGDLRIRAGDAEIILAGGMEWMSQSPYLVEAKTARFGKRMGHAKFVDAMLADGMECPMALVHMAVHGAKVAEEFNVSREAQDEWALRSHQLAIKAQSEGRLQEEILPVSVPQPKGPARSVDKDEAPRADTTLEALKALK